MSAASRAAAVPLVGRGALARSAFPEREDRPRHAADRWALGVAARLRRRVRGSAAREVAAFQGLLDDEAPALRAQSDAELATALRTAARAALDPRAVAERRRALLLVAEGARRALGMTPYATQLAAAATLLRGRLAEMATGEGKTLTAGLAACVAGSAGVPTHVVTVNDYLAERDAARLAPLFRWAGLSVGCALQGEPPEAHRAAYACRITYATGKEIVFDYLRDRVAARGRASGAQLAARAVWGEAAPPPLLRGLHFAIVDEADSIMIDEARTPLILAEKAGAIAEADVLPQALALARTLVRDEDFLLDPGRRELRLTESGRDRLAALAAARAPGGAFASSVSREHLALQALRALHLFARDRQYLVDDENRVQIVDEYTGRVLPGRVWEHGLHQLIECKEGVAFSERTRTLSRITYQRFFARYLRLSGMTGTAREAALELAVVYGLDTVAVPLHRPSRRVRHPDRVLPDTAAKWAAVAAQIADCHARGQPVLVGTRSVAASEQLAARLGEIGVPHRVLNARQDAAEADVVAAAGQRGAVTVATNMAGRGTDIELGEGVEALGGLCVLLTDFHESSRIDRQLLGRCARQGQPGQARAYLALQDELLRQHGAPWQRWLLAAARRVAAPGRDCPWPLALAAAALRRWSQRRAERLHARTRRETLQHDRELERSMGFAGDPT